MPACSEHTLATRPERPLEISVRLGLTPSSVRCRRGVLAALPLALGFLLTACHAQSSTREPHDVAAPPASSRSSAPSSAPSPELASPAPSAPKSRQSELASKFAGKRALTVLHGSATYYSNKFAGRKTASGSTYDPREFTAAHRKLPFGTVLRVVRRDNGKTTYVRVTDRGPFGSRKRIVDLSRAAAEELDMLRDGVVKVRVEVVSYGKKR